MINKIKVITIQDKIKLAIAKIEKEENVEISFGTRNYDSSKYTTKMTVKTTAKDTKTVKAVSDVNTQLSANYGFSENIVGKSFVSNGNTYTITEFKTRNRKYPIIATSTANGRNYKFTTNQVKTQLV